MLRPKPITSRPASPVARRLPFFEHGVEAPHQIARQRKKRLPQSRELRTMRSSFEKLATELRL